MTYRDLSRDLHAASINHNDHRHRVSVFGDSEYDRSGIAFWGGLESMYRREWDLAGAQHAEWDAPLPNDSQARIAAHKAAAGAT